MEARGYRQDPNGDLAAPSGAIVATRGPNPFAALARSSPAIAARQDYDQAVANYQTCLAANSSNPNACEGQRNIMNADAQVLSASNASQQSNNASQPRYDPLGRDDPASPWFRR
jgi:hypothetical protein